MATRRPGATQKRPTKRKKKEIKPREMLEKKINSLMTSYDDENKYKKKPGFITKAISVDTAPKTILRNTRKKGPSNDQSLIFT
jgi:hypothetical protein